MNEESKDPVCHRGPKDTTLEPPKLEDTLLITPSTGKWLQKEHADQQTPLGVDIAMLLERSGNTDVVEVFCSPNSVLTRTAHQSGLTAERWPMDDLDLSTTLGYKLAERRLCRTRPKRLWLLP